jgi:hypothetical protein
MSAPITGTLLLIAGLYACGNPADTSSTKETEMPMVTSFERDGQMIDEFVVGNSVLQIPREYAVIQSTTDNLNLRTHWPGLVPSTKAHALPSASRIQLIFQPQARHATTLVHERELREYAARRELWGPERNEDTSLAVYKDSEQRSRLMISSEYLTPFGTPFYFTCAAASNRDENTQECRATYKLTADLHLQYRFHSVFIPQWREVDAEVRTFALSLVRRN